MTDFKNDPDNYENIRTPRYVYVTFKKDVAFHKILKLSENKETSLQYQGETLKIQRAQQPTNILWENFEFTKKQRRVRWGASISCIAISGILYFIFAAIALQTLELKSFLQSPPTVNCE